MLTKVILEGPMGKAFGRTWELAVKSPSEALRVINANKPGVFAWVRANLSKYSRYRVVVEYTDGRKESLDNDSYRLNRSVKSIRFVPLVEGAGGAARIVLGIIIAVVNSFTAKSPAVYAFAASLIMGGIAELLTSKPKTNEQETYDGKTSHYFDGPVNTTEQGVPVPLIYGTCLVGSHSISSAITVDQLI